MIPQRNISLLANRLAYATTETTPLHIKVIYNELKDFEKSLITHARIENEILFPKAMSLETRVKQSFYSKVSSN